MATQKILGYNDTVKKALQKASRIPENNAGNPDTNVPRQPLMMRQAAEEGSGGTSTVTVDYVYRGAFQTVLQSGENEGTSGYWLKVIDGVARESGVCGVVYIGHTDFHASTCGAFFPNDGSTEGINAYFFLLYDASTGTNRGYYSGVTLATGTAVPTGTYTGSDGTSTTVNLGTYNQSFYTPLSFIKRTGSVTNTQTYMQDYMRIDGRFVE